MSFAYNPYVNSTGAQLPTPSTPTAGGPQKKKVAPFIVGGTGKPFVPPMYPTAKGPEPGYGMVPPVRGGGIQPGGGYTGYPPAYPTQQAGGGTGLDPSTPRPLPAPSPAGQTNPLESKMALGAAIDDRYAPGQISTGAINRGTQALGMGQYLDTNALAGRDVNLASQIADKDYRDAQREHLNRYAGVGISGNKMRRGLEMAQDYSLGKAKNVADIVRGYDELGYQRNLDTRKFVGDIAGKNLDAGMGIYKTQAGLAGDEAQRELTAGEGAATRGHQVALQHDQQGHETALQNMANRGMLQGAAAGFLLDRAFPEPQTAQDRYLEMLTMKESPSKWVNGVEQYDYSPQISTGGSGINMQNLMNVPWMKELLSGIGVGG